MSSPHRSRPRTRIVSSLEDEIADERCAWEPIFTGLTSFRIANYDSECEYGGHGPRRATKLSRTRSGTEARPNLFSDSEIECAHEAPYRRRAATRSHGRAREGTRCDPRLQARSAFVDVERDRGPRAA